MLTLLNGWTLPQVLARFELVPDTALGCRRAAFPKRIVTWRDSPRYYNDADQTCCGVGCLFPPAFQPQMSEWMFGIAELDDPYFSMASAADIKRLRKLLPLTPTQLVDFQAAHDNAWKTDGLTARQACKNLARKSLQ